MENKVEEREQMETHEDQGSRVNGYLISRGK